MLQMLGRVLLDFVYVSSALFFVSSVVLCCIGFILGFRSLIQDLGRS